MKRTRGSILLLTLVVMAILLVLIAAALTATSTGARLQAGRVLHEQAFYLAEAGRQRAVTTLARDGRWRYDGDTFALGSGTYTVTVVETRQGPRKSDFLVTSTGTVQSPEGPLQEIVSYAVTVQTNPGNKVKSLDAVADSWSRR